MSNQYSETFESWEEMKEFWNRPQKEVKKKEPVKISKEEQVEAIRNVLKRKKQ